MANNISSWLGVTGPAYTIDAACSSSLYAMEHAYMAISSGKCDYAIVGGSNLCLHPFVSLQFSRLGIDYANLFKEFVIYFLQIILKNCTII